MIEASSMGISKLTEMLRYMMNISLPDELIETRQMKKLWFECMRCII